MSQPKTVAERLALRLAYTRDVIHTSIRRRWGSTEWDVLFPWWREPRKIRILMYADGLVTFSGGFFGGLEYVRTVLESRLHFYADFEVTTAHRDGDPADGGLPPQKLTELDILNRFDEIWFFGFNTAPNLTDQERDELDEFMGSGKRRGVLVTGDHFDRGRSIAGQITRAGKMRRYPAPDSNASDLHSTLEEGPDPNDLFDENDQYDDRPQKVRLTHFPRWTPDGRRRGFRPHPLMCGPRGPINLFPDHKHEGEAVTPEKPDAGEWPAVNGHRELPVVIARGVINDPESDKFGQEIGLVSAYDGHEVNVGRIVADSSWHHWFDGNLLGLPGLSPPHPYAGFDATPEGDEVLRNLDAYFLNCATWLAPPDRQAEMRRSAWWFVLWTDSIAELSADAPLPHLGAAALEALSGLASSGSIAGWVLDVPAFREQISNRRLPELFGRFEFVNLPFEQYAAGGIIRELMMKVGPARPDFRFLSAAPSDEELESAINEGAAAGLSALTERLKSEATLLSALAANSFRLK